MRRIFVFDDLSLAVAGCEQLADDLVDFNFRTNPDFTIEILSQPPANTRRWLYAVAKEMVVEVSQ